MPLPEFNLVLSYVNGEGVAQDIELSYIWRFITENNSSESAAKARAVLAERLTQAQLIGA